MYGDDLTWRLESIHAEIDNLVMFAAAWESMTNIQRRDVHARWNGLVCRQIDDIRWGWRRYAREPEPAWWVRLRDAIIENQRLIDYMELQRPRIEDVPVRWVLKWVPVEEA